MKFILCPTSVLRRVEWSIALSESETLLFPTEQRLAEGWYFGDGLEAASETDLIAQTAPSRLELCAYDLI